MKLPPEQRERVLEVLQERWHQPMQCSACGKSKWSVTDSIFELREYRQGKIVGRSTVIPLMVANCTSCGHAIFFNAIVLGIIDPQTGDLKP